MSARPPIATCSEPRSGCVGAVLRRVRAALVLVGAASCLAWAVGFVVTDHWRWSQFLWWVPWFVYAAAALPGAMAAIGRPSRWRTVARVVALGVVVMIGTGVVRDVGWSRSASPTSALSLVQWNASWIDVRTGAIASERVLALNADVVVLSNPFRFFGHNRIAVWRDQGYEVREYGTFALASRLPVVDARILFSYEGMSAFVAEVDATSTLGRTITITAVDLPSSPRIGRMGLAHTFVERLAEAGAPPADILLGDCNVTRGSASLAVLAPGLTNAWSQGGEGWGASFPRERPLLHLDHVLIGPGLRAASCRFIDLGVESHRAQLVQIVATG